MINKINDMLPEIIFKKDIYGIPDIIIAF